MTKAVLYGFNSRGHNIRRIVRRMCQFKVLGVIMGRRIALVEAEEALADAPALLRIKEVAEISRVHERTVRRAIADGRLASLRRGTRSILVPKSALINFLVHGVS